MKAYGAIGHWAENKNATVSVALRCSNKDDFRRQLAGNGFVPYVIITEKKLETLKNVYDMDLYDEVKKLTSNYRIWNHICDYVDQCIDILEEKMQNA